PQFMDKYTKKWGGKVGQTRIPSRTSPDWHIVPHGATDFAVMDEVGNTIKIVRSRGEGENLIAKYKKPDTAPVHSIDITPAMREAILKEGQPMWGNRDALTKAVGGEEGEEEIPYLIYPYTSEGKNRKTRRIVILLRKAAEYHIAQGSLFPDITPHGHLPVPEPIYGKPNEDFLESYHHAYDDDIAQLADEQGLTSEDYLSEVNRHLKNMLAGTVIKKRARYADVPKLLNDDRFRTQFETNTSSGLLSPSTRAAWEEYAFGIPNHFDADNYDIDPETEEPIPMKPEDPIHRPIYGYIDEANARSPHYGASQYGDVDFVMKPHVRNRTTFTWRD